MLSLPTSVRIFLSRGATVALLMLKGFSHKEIAGARSVGEATVRQQAAAIYRKAGVD